MNILKYDSSNRPYEIYEIVKDLQKYFEPNQLIAIPVEMEIMLDCSLEDLYYVKNMIDKAIQDKETTNESQISQ